MMRDGLEDGRLQVIAAASLLEKSGLVKWNPQVALFVPVDLQAFKSTWRDNLDPVFGRLMAWILFSAGAEFLAKGVCLVNGVEIREELDVPLSPTVPIPTWAPGFRKNWRSAGTTKATKFGTMGNLTSYDKKTKVDAALKRLCSVVGATIDQEDLLLAAYDFLCRACRNRDAHAYVPKTRDSQFSLAAEIFPECFNMLMTWLPGGPATLNAWRLDAEPFIASL